MPAEVDKLKTDTPLFRVESLERVTWLEPKLVCEVIYQVTRDCKLRIRRFHRPRADKKTRECTLDQIAP